MSPDLARLARMDSGELVWRGRAALRTAAHRFAFMLRAPRWNRRDLAGRLTRDASLDTVRRALARGEWTAAHVELQRHVLQRPSRFVVTPAARSRTTARIARRFPDAGADAAARADRILDGRYDLLGYRDLRFSPADSPSDRVDWHFDPVHDRRAPRTFWSTVAYLDPACGDHKVIWELNRHQHWLSLGRAFWLTGDVRYRTRFAGELASWMAANPPLAGINWASMLELGFRTLSWTWALHLFADSRTGADEPWSVDLLLAIDRQLTHVEQNLSYYFSPNTHLLGEALALYVCGRALPELAASARRANTGRRILVAEIARQICADGGHCERSTHYHRYTLDFYAFALAIARTTRDPIAPVFERAVHRLAAAARLMTDGNGRAPHIGDDDGGRLCPITGRDADDWRDSLGFAASLTGCENFRVDRVSEEEIWLGAEPRAEPATRVRSGSGALEQTGYFISRSPAGTHLVVDGGPHGYRNAGHAHADALSLTLTLRGRPFVVDRGTACYTIDPALRDRFRSTASHNTLVLDGRPQSVSRGPFHWSQSTDAVTHRWRSTDGFDYFDGSHAGYRPSEHRRRVLMLHDDVMIVADHVGSPADGTPLQASVHWHLAPDWLADVRGGTASLAAAGEHAALHVAHGEIEPFHGDAATGLGWHSPVYGRIEPATTLRISHSGPAPFWIASVFDFNATDPVTAVDWLPVWAEAGTAAQSAALRIARGGSTDYVLFAEARSDARPRWRIADFETDAAMLLCRVARRGEVTRVALVDGSIVRSGGRRALGLTLGRVRPALFIDEHTIRNFTPCAASPGS